MTETVSTPPKFPMARECPFHPPAKYGELRVSSPISRVTLPTGNTSWVVTNHEYARQLLADPRVSVNRAHPGYPALVPGAAAFGKHAKGFLTWMDAPEHTRHRRMVVNEFTTKRLAGIRPRIQAIVDDCVDKLAGDTPPVDLVPALSLPVPSLVICELLGVPYADREHFQRRASVLDDRNSTVQEKVAAFQETRVYIGELVASKDGEPGDDLLSRLIKKYRDADDYDHELVAGMAMLLLTSGFETTANMISLGVVGLLEHPEQRDQLTANPEMAPQAVEELLRFFSIAEISTSRVVLSDIEIGDVVLREGDGVIVLNAAGNRDESVFDDPDTLDIDRDDSRHHLAFGYGAHQCLGQNLARLELQIVYTTLFRRIPSLKLAVPFDELQFKTDTNFYGLHELPVTW